MDTKLKPPFPYFGGKRLVAPHIWKKLGTVSNYVEPFCGSLAVLLANSIIPKIETVNDIDCYISNFWRAVAAEPEKVAEYADHPINEADLHARHRWLVSNSTDEFRQKMHSDPDYYDVKIAGWWVWGQCASVGNNWLSTKGLNALPLLSFAGGGIQGLTYKILEEFNRLKTRLARVRVCCGDWKRVITPSVTHNNGGLGAKEITGVFLDPPYEQKVRDKVYKEDNNVFNEVVDWAVMNGDNPRMRIVLCGYDGDHAIPGTWEKYNWKANGGLSSLANSNTRGKQNRLSETIWFSPHCLKD
jgi:DNA adenine methylase